MRWTFQTLNAVVDEEIKALPSDRQARLLHFAELIEQAGFEALPREAVKHLEGKLWELRITARDQAEWNPVSRPDHALNDKVRARSDAKPVPTFADRALAAMESRAPST